MCGLCGVFGHIGDKEKNAFGVLQMLSQLRGKDSTGVGLIYTNKKQKPSVLKSVGGQESLALDNEKYFNETSWNLKENGLLCVIGHNRWATVGVINEENAHPFHIKNIIGCHNGTIPLYEMTHLDTHSYKLTDSQIIFNELSEGKSIVDTIEFLKGAWALTWFDTKTRELNMCRNRERTLFVVKTTDQKTMFWASESWMLSVALARSGIKHEDIFSLIKDKHLVWKVGKGGAVSIKEVNDAFGGKVKPWRAPLSDWFKSSKSNVYPLHDDKEDKEFEPDYVNTFNNRFVPRRRFEALVKDGCAYCTGDIGWGDRNNIVWENEETPMCIDCAEHLTGIAEVN